MANGQLGNFQDYEQENWEKGNSNSQPKPVASNNPLASNPYLNNFMQNPGELKISRAGEEIGQAQSQPTFEVNAYQRNLSAGTMTFDRETMSVEFRIQEIQNQMKETFEEKMDETLEQKWSQESKPVEKAVQKHAENFAKTAITTVNRASKGIFGFLKDIFGAFKSLYKEVTFKIYTKEEKKKMDEAKKKAAERGAVKKGFFQKIDENSRNLMMENMKKLSELEDRLMISGMSIEQRNKYLGRRRNMSFAERNAHLAHFIARAMQEEQDTQVKQEKQAKMVQTQNKGGMDLNKVAEGGSVLSSTGGQGAG